MIFYIYFIFCTIGEYQCNTKITDQQPQFSLSPAQIPDLRYWANVTASYRVKAEQCEPATWKFCSGDNNILQSYFLEIWRQQINIFNNYYIALSISEMNYKQNIHSFCWQLWAGFPQIGLGFKRLQVSNKKKTYEEETFDLWSVWFNLY